MIKTVDNLIKKNVADVISNHYILDDYIFDDDKVSVYDLIQVGKVRAQIQSEYFDKLKVTPLFSEFIEDISVHGNNDGDELIIQLVPNKHYDLQSINGNHNILIKYDLKDGKTSFFNSLYFNKKNKDIINTVFLKSDEVMKTIFWAIRNDFHQESSFRTAYSDDFIVNFHNRFLSISLPCGFDNSDKIFTLYYQYNQNYSDPGVILKTGDGTFRIRTNVKGLESLLTSHRYDASSLPNGGAIYPTNDFVRNLMVDEKVLPEFLRKETAKVRTRIKNI